MGFTIPSSAIQWPHVVPDPCTDATQQQILAPGPPHQWQSVCVIVETKIVGNKDTESLHVAVSADVGSLRDLLSELVRHELGAYEKRRSASVALRVLTPADLARGVDTGVYGRERRAAAAPPTESEAVARAVEAFTDGLFFVFIDEVQVEELDAPVVIGADTKLRLVRLVALAGG